jgi:glycosyltransferase involved in cell wall biosynthesis
VVSNLWPPHAIGGYELGAYDVVERLRARGHDVTVLTSTFGVPGPRVEEGVHRLLPYDRVYADHLGARALLRGAGRVRRFLEQARWDLVYLMSPLGLGSRLVQDLAESGRPLVAYVSDHWLAQWPWGDAFYAHWMAPRSGLGLPRRVLRAVARRGLRGARVLPRHPATLPLEHVQFVSRFIRNASRLRLDALVTEEIIPWGLDVARFPFRKRRAEELRQWRYVGRLDEEKGVHTAVEAVARLRAAGEDVTLVVFGRDTTPYAGRLKAEVAARGLAEHVRFAGARPRARLAEEAYAGGGLLVFPAIWDEPFSITLLEAFASGLPVLSTRTGGTGELVRDGENASVFAAGSVESLCRRWRALVRAPEHALAMARRARADVLGERTLDRMVDRVEAHLRAVAARPAPARPAVPRTPPPVVTQAARLLTPRAFRVLFVSSDAGFVSHRYRVHHYGEYLARAGVDASVVLEHELPALLPRVPLHDVVVAFRLAMTPVVADLYAACRRAGVPVVYDVDDLVFDPEIVVPRWVDGLRALAGEALAAYLDRIPRYREALLAADRCTTTTETLAARCRALGRATAVLPNGLDPHAPSPETDVPSDGVEVRLGYFSGTPTHQRDFAVAAPALARILEEFAFVRLRVVGALALREFPALGRFGARVESRPLVPWEALRDEVADVDVSLAPLEVGNPYCEAKSEIKWIEAAAVGVPTVASATAPFQAAIADGETGFLARTEDEWHQALARLVSDAALRRRVGDAARRVVEARYAPAHLGAGARAAYVDAIEAVRARGPWPASALAVTVVLPPYRTRDAGLASPLELATVFAERGHEVRVVIDGDATDTDRSRDALRDDGWLRHLRFAGRIADLVACDALVAATPEVAAALRCRADHAVTIIHFTDEEQGSGRRLILPDGAESAVGGEHGARVIDRVEAYVRTVAARPDVRG